MSQNREFDLVVFGATGFTGQLVVKNLKKEAGPNLKWAIAGRREDALKKIAEGSSAGIIVCDSGNETQCKNLAMRTNVVLAMAGPFSIIGRNIVKACAESGTDYADITGETVPFVRDSIKNLHELAKEKGSRIVHCCGYDSVPSDLLAKKVLETIRSQSKSDNVQITLGMDADKSELPISGGSFATAIAIIELALANKEERKELANPYSCGGQPEGQSKEQKSAQYDVKGFGYSTSLQAWYCPFMMAGVNTRIVRRSMTGLNADYKEVMCFRGPFAMLNAMSTWFVRTVLQILMLASCTRRLISYMIPPGAGPTEKQQREGYWRMVVGAETNDCYAYGDAVALNQDPGYLCTSRMCSEAAICLVETRKLSNRDGGVLTPATAFDSLFETKLSKHGINFNTSILPQPNTMLFQYEFWNGLIFGTAAIVMYLMICSKFGFLVATLISYGAVQISSKIKQLGKTSA